MVLEIIEHQGKKYAEVIRAGIKVDSTQFISPPESSFQFGLLAHRAGFYEPPHYHRPFSREIRDVQQMFVMQRGVVVIDIFGESGNLLQKVTLHAGDAIVLIQGVHALRVLEDFQAISVKQGPYLGTAYDKVEVQVK